MPKPAHPVGRPQSLGAQHIAAVLAIQHRRLREPADRAETTGHQGQPPVVHQSFSGNGQRLIEQGTPAALYNTGSENSFFVAVSHSAAYVASKHAVLGLTDCLREEMPEYVSVGMIAPGFVGSELIPASMRPMGMPVDEFAERVVPQMLAGEPYVVTHGYNQVRIDERQSQIARAYERSAPRAEGDERYDVKVLLESLKSQG